MEKRRQSINPKPKPTEANNTGSFSNPNPIHTGRNRNQYNLRMRFDKVNLIISTVAVFGVGGGVYV